MTPLKAITITRIRSNQETRSLFDFPLAAFNFSWDATVLPHSSRYGLFLRDYTLIAAFTSPTSPWSERTDRCGEFVRGLWEYDVGEIFIHAPLSGEYQEFNLAPSGAWWTCHFSDYRNESQKIIDPPPLGSFTANGQSSGWCAAIEIPLSTISIPFHSLEELRMNVTLIEGKAPRKYLSAARINTPEPDFHHLQSYLPPVIV